MAVTQIQVINAALFLIGAKKITALSDDSKAARGAKTMYEMARNEVFDLPIAFKFAITRAELSQYGTDPSIGSYDYQYELPADCRRVIAQVDEDNDDVEYEHRIGMFKDGRKRVRVLLTNQDECFIKYIVVIVSENDWPGWFAKLVYINLATLLCEPLKQDKQKKNQLMLMFEDARISAESSNAMWEADVNDDNTRLDKGNTDVVSAARVKEVSKRYIQVRTE